jgi:hypothetical protein
MNFTKKTLFYPAVIRKTGLTSHFIIDCLATAGYFLTKTLNMKTLFLFIAMLAFVACKKELTEIQPKPRYLIKYQIDCNTSGFDLTYTNAIMKIEKKSISAMHWDTTFLNLYNDSLMLSATPKNIYSKVTGQIDYNGIKVNSMTTDNSNKNLNFCYVICGYVIK